MAGVDGGLRGLLPAWGAGTCPVPRAALPRPTGRALSMTVPPVPVRPCGGASVRACLGPWVTRSTPFPGPRYTCLVVASLHR